MAFERDFYRKTHKKNGRIVQPRHLYPVLTGDQLLADPKRKILLRKIKQYCGLNEKQYEKLYLNLILDFAEFVQILPSGPGGKIGGMLDDGLERAAFATQFSAEDPQRKNNLRFIYAAFSAALLDNIGRVLTQQKVFVTDQSGIIINEWKPLNPEHTFMRDVGDYYKILNFAGGWAVLNHFTTLLLARQLMPVAGLLWLSQDKLLFQMWLAVLVGDESSGGALAHLLWLVEKRIEELRAKQMELPAIEIEEETLKETPVEDFVEWVEEKVKDKEILINKKSDNNMEIHIIEESAESVINKEVFETFYQEKKMTRQEQEKFEKEFSKVMGVGETKHEIRYSIEEAAKAVAREKESFFSKPPEYFGRLVNLNWYRGIGFADLPPSPAQVQAKQLQQEALEQVFDMLVVEARTPTVTPGS